MELRIVVTPKLLEEAVVYLMEAKFNTKITDSCIIIAESCNLTESGGVTAILTAVDVPVNYSAMHGSLTDYSRADASTNTTIPCSVSPQMLDEWQKTQVRNMIGSNKLAQQTPYSS